VQPLLDEFNQLCLAQGYDAALDLMLNLPLAATKADSSLYRLLSKWGEYQRLVDMGEQLAAGRGATLNPQNRHVVLGNLGFAYDMLGNFREALRYHQMVKTLVVQNASSGMELGPDADITSLSALASTYHSLGQYKRAMSYSQQVLDKIGGDVSQLIKTGALTIQGAIHSAVGQSRQALNFHEQVYQIAQGLSNSDILSQAIANLGHAYLELAQHEQAFGYLQLAYEMRRQSGGKGALYDSLVSFGTYYSRLGDYEQARSYADQALSLAEQLGSLHKKAVALHNIAHIHMRQERFEQAVVANEAALQLTVLSGDSNAEAAAHSNVGYNLLRLDRPVEAADHYRQGLTIAEQNDQHLIKASILGGFGLLNLYRGDGKAAVRYLKQALAIFVDTDADGQLSTVWHHLGEAYQQVGSSTIALSCYYKALALREAIRYPLIGETHREIAKLELTLLPNVKTKIKAQAERNAKRADWRPYAEAEVLT